MRSSVDATFETSLVDIYPEGAVPRVTVNGLGMHYEQLGSGPPLVLITGIPGTAANWLPFAERLKNDFTITVFDNRGSGFTDKPEDYYSIKQMAADAAGLIEQLRLGPSNVFGISMGGMIAQELAINHRQLVRRLVLGCTQCGGSQVIPPGEEVNQAFAFPDDDWGARMRLLGPLAFSATTRRERPDFIEAFVTLKTAEPQPLYAYRRQIGACVRHDTYERLDRIACPTLVVTGTDDDVILAANSETLHRRIPGSSLRYLPGAGHLFFLEQPEATAALLKEFLFQASQC